MAVHSVFQGGVYHPDAVIGNFKDAGVDEVELIGDGGLDDGGVHAVIFNLIISGDAYKKEVSGPDLLLCRGAGNGERCQYYSKYSFHTGTKILLFQILSAKKSIFVGYYYSNNMNTKEPFVITISRELGSGGRTIGKKLAAQLGVRYSDKDLIQGLMKKFNLTTNEIERIKGKKRNWLSDFLEIVAPVPNSGAYIGFDPIKGSDLNLSIKQEDIFEAEKEIIGGIAAEGSCVIAGRLGFSVLKDHPNHLHIFIHAPLEQRIQRVMKKQNLTHDEAAAVIKSVDETRENYIKRYAGVSRYDTRNYDLAINVAGMTEDEAVLCILKFIKYSE